MRSPICERFDAARAGRRYGRRRRRSAAASSTTTTSAASISRQRRVPLGVVLERHRCSTCDDDAAAGDLRRLDHHRHLAARLPRRERSSRRSATRDPLASIWIGNRTRIAAHQDLPDNLACVRRRPAPLHAVPARAARQPLPRPARLTPGRAGDQHGRFRRARPRALPALRRGAASTRRSPSSSPATRCSSRACGGTTSRRWTASTCWSTTGGDRRPAFMDTPHERADAARC